MVCTNLYCFNCHETKDENEFTLFKRNPSLADRNGKVIWCKRCASKYIEDNDNTIESLKVLLRMLDIPYVESYAKSALESFKKKRENTNIIIKKNVYSNEEEVSGIETTKLQTTLYTCYSAKLGLMPKKYINYSFSDGIRNNEEMQDEPKESDDEKNARLAEKYIRKLYGDKIFEDKKKLAKAISLSMEEFSLHKNNVNKRQQKFKLKSNIMALINVGILDKKDYSYIIDDKDVASNTSDGLIEVEVEESEVIKPIAFKPPKDFDIQAMSDKWGYGYTPEQLYAFEKKYQLLKNNYPEKTALHTEGLLTYIRYRVNEEMATAKGDVKSAKDWGELASKQATNAKINVAQLSKSDLSDGLDSFSALTKAVETAVDIIPILPKFKEKPQDKVDFTLWCYINYVRDLKGLPPAEYSEIYNFYEQRRKEYEQRSENIMANEEDISDEEYNLGDVEGDSDA